MLSTMKYCLFILSFVLVSCIQEEETGLAPVSPSRTVLVYMAADNSLSEETAQKIEALRQGWRRTGSKCLIYVDTPDGARLLRLRGGCQTAPTPYVETIAEYGLENSASAAVFGRVIRDVTAAYPAESYGLIFFSHASGWLPAGTLQNPARTVPETPGMLTSLTAPGTRSVGQDDGVDTPDGIGHAGMELSEFSAAIPDGLFDFIVFEACLMAGVEVAYALREKTDYILASSAEIVSPGFTPIYRSASWHLSDTSKSVEESLTVFGKAYLNHVNEQSGDRCSATLSLVAAKELTLLAVRTRDLLAGQPLHRSDIISCLQHFDRPGSYGDSPAVARYLDMGDWAQQTGKPEQYTALEEQLKRTVRWAASTKRFLPSQNGFEIRRHSGLTVYAEQPELPTLNAYYHSTGWYKAVSENQTN